MYKGPREFQKLMNYRKAVEKKKAEEERKNNPPKKKIVKPKVVKGINFGKLVKGLHQKKYDKFLKSRYWKEIRKIILNRDGFKCTICGGE